MKSSAHIYQQEHFLDLANIDRPSIDTIIRLEEDVELQRYLLVAYMYRSEDEDRKPSPEDYEVEFNSELEAVSATYHLFIKEYAKMEGSTEKAFERLLWKKYTSFSRNPF